MLCANFKVRIFEGEKKSFEILKSTQLVLVVVCTYRRCSTLFLVMCFTLKPLVFSKVIPLKQIQTVYTNFSTNLFFLLFVYLHFNILLSFLANTMTRDL